MTHTKMQVDEWEEVFCDACGHAAYLHHDEPEEVRDFATGEYIYTAVGCMVIMPPLEARGRVLPGDNPYLRCPCMKVV